MNSEKKSAETTPLRERNTLARPVHPFLLILFVAVAFAVYWATSYILEENKASTRFGADTWFYTEIADGDALGRLHESQYLGRVFRFHPVTVIAGTIWMNALDWLTYVFEQEQVLRAMFALVGALGGYAAMSGFAAVMLRRHVVFWGLVYAASLAVWYFSSIEESKIVSATLATAYIAIYIHLRENWTQRGAILLTIVLFLACMNEIVAGFLVIVPVVDTFMRYGIDFLRGRWILLHATVGPLALGILEWIARGNFNSVKEHPEGGTHFSMLFWYITQNEYSFAAVYAFVVRWLFFSIGAPEAKVYFANPAIGYGGDFYPSLLLYFYSPAAAAVAVLFLVLLAATFLPRFRAAMTRDVTGIMTALAAYIFVRGAFFFLLLPQEYMLFASSVTFAILLLVAIPFAKSSFPRKRVLLALFATALFLANGAFMLAP
jgi:hypothetical protein